MPDPAKTAWRRLYVFLAVALAMFLATMSAIGMVCHGFATSIARPNQITVTKSLPVPTEIKTALAAAQRQGHDAYQAVQLAVDQYQATDVELQDLISQHFDDLLQTAAIAATPANVAPRNVAAPQPVPTKDTAALPLDQLNDQTIPPTQSPRHAEVNPRYQDLEDQIVQLRRQRTVLSDTLLPNHPSIQKLDLSLSDLEDRLKSVQKEAPSPVTGYQNPLPPKPIAVQPSPVAPVAPPQPDVFATLLPRWQKIADDYRELTARQQTEKNQCYDALNHESAAWQKKADIPAEYIATLTTQIPSAPLQGADPQLAIYWSGLMALLVAALVARSAQVSEAMFQSAAQVRQRLALTVLGLLPRRMGTTARKAPRAEPRWVRRTLVAAELYLAAVLALLLVFSLLDRQFFNHFLANPLAAYSQKFW